MSKTLLGLLFILAGLAYGSMAIDTVYNHTLGWMIENKWMTPPTAAQKPTPSLLGRKGTILSYAAGFIIIGIFILWTHTS